MHILAILIEMARGCLELHFLFYYFFLTFHSVWMARVSMVWSSVFYSSHLNSLDANRLFLKQRRKKMVMVSWWLPLWWRPGAAVSLTPKRHSCWNWKTFHPATWTKSSDRQFVSASHSSWTELGATFHQAATDVMCRPWRQRETKHCQQLAEVC